MNSRRTRTLQRIRPRTNHRTQASRRGAAAVADPRPLLITLFALAAAAAALLLPRTADAQVPADTVEVRVVKEGAPVPGTSVKLVGEPPGGGEVGYGEAVTDASGVARFEVPHRPGLFLVAHTDFEGVRYTSDKRSFGSDAGQGVALGLQVFGRAGATASDLTISPASHVVVQLEEGALEVTEFLTVENGSRSTYAPEEGLVIPLPKGFFDVRGAGGNPVEHVEHRGARVPGPFLPGQNEVRLRFKLPVEGQDLEFRQQMPVLGRSIQLVVDDSPDLAIGGPMVRGQELRENADGVKFRVAALATPEGLVAFRLTGLPNRVTHGRWVALSLALGMVALGLVAGIAPRRRGTGGEAARRLAARERDDILADLEQLERDRREGRAPPAAYEEDRSELLERLGTVLRRLES